MTYSKTPLKGKSVRDLEFLTGYCKGKTGEDVFEEYWLPEINSNKVCVFRWIKKGEVYIYEIVALIERDDETHMLLRHFDKSFTAWEEKDTLEFFDHEPDCTVNFSLTFNRHANEW
jgi:hypothetical protein